MKQKGMIWIAFMIVGLMGCAPAIKDLKPALGASDTGRIWFQTPGSLIAAQKNFQFAPGQAQILSGNLKLPKGVGPFPGVILAHGAAGITPTETEWEKQLLNLGYATFLLDSFGGRGLTEVYSQQKALTPVQRVPDAYGALRILATHPMIDARRIALMGFSHGAILTLDASTLWAKETFTNESGPAFRAFIAVYPYCNNTFPELTRLSAPLRIHSGELDDWAPAEPCQQLVEKLQKAEVDASIIIYPSAHHAFDNPTQSFKQITTVYSYKNCLYELDSILGPYPTDDERAKCRQSGATVAGNPEATNQAHRNVGDQLSELLK